MRSDFRECVVESFRFCSKHLLTICIPPIESSLMKCKPLLFIKFVVNMCDEIKKSAYLCCDSEIFSREFIYDID